MSAPATEHLDFGGLDIVFDDRVLRPRPWTLAQSHWAQEILPGLPAGPVLELCCGAGHIGLRAVLGSDRPLVCVDASPAAVELTRHNADRLDLGSRVTVLHGRIGEVLEADQRFALVVADPPWVPREETARFPEDPLLAIDGGPDGLDVVRSVLREIETHLLARGSALLQLGTTHQADAVADLISTPGSGSLRRVEVRPCDGGVLVRLDRT